MSSDPLASLAAWRQAGDELSYRGQRIFYREAGSGPALLCLHGFPTASWDWHRLWPELTRRCRVLAPDFLGYGFSAKPRRWAYSTFDQADLIEVLLAGRGVEAAHVLAHDYGDTVAQELLARQAEGRLGFEIRTLGLLNGGIFVEATRPRRIQRLLLTPLGPWLGRFYSRRSFDRTFASIFGAATRPSPAELADFWRLVERDGGRRIIHRLIRYIAERQQHRERWVGALVAAPLPRRLVIGLDDPVSGRTIADRYAELVPRPDVVRLPGVGHYPQVEAPNAVLEAWEGLVARST